MLGERGRDHGRVDQPAAAAASASSGRTRRRRGRGRCPCGDGRAGRRRLDPGRRGRASSRGTSCRSPGTAAPAAAPAASRRASCRGAWPPSSPRQARSECTRPIAAGTKTSSVRSIAARSAAGSFGAALTDGAASRCHGGNDDDPERDAHPPTLAKIDCRLQGLRARPEHREPGRERPRRARCPSTIASVSPAARRDVAAGGAADPHRAVGVDRRARPMSVGRCRGSARTTTRSQPIRARPAGRAAGRGPARARPPSGGSRAAGRARPAAVTLGRTAPGTVKTPPGRPPPAELHVDRHRGPPRHRQRPAHPQRRLGLDMCLRRRRLPGDLPEPRDHRRTVVLRPQPRQHALQRGAGRLPGNRLQPPPGGVRQPHGPPAAPALDRDPQRQPGAASADLQRRRRRQHAVLVRKPLPDDAQVAEPRLRLRPGPRRRRASPARG